MKQIDILRQFFSIEGQNGTFYCVRCMVDSRLTVTSLEYIRANKDLTLPWGWNQSKTKTLDITQLSKVRPISNNDLGSPYMAKSRSCMSLSLMTPDSMDYDIHNALNKLEKAVGGDITKFVCERLRWSESEVCQRLAAEQIDGVALAIYNIEARNQGIIIGDQTGVGKGRMAAALVRYAHIQGLKPIFLTEKVNLFSDFYRDLKATGSAELKPFIINERKGDSNIIDEEEKDNNGNPKVVYQAPQKAAQDAAIKEGVIPNGYDYVLATYSQFSKNGSVKQNYLESISKDNILIMDEAHNSGGEGNTAMFFINMLQTVRGVCYLSATFAKRPSNMPVYAMKTCIGDTGLSSDVLVSNIEEGGVALQEVLASNLVAEGQMIRRERSFDGIEVNYITLNKEGAKNFGVEDKESEHKALLNNITEIIREIIAFENEFINKTIEQKNKDIKNLQKQEDYKKAQGTKEAGLKNSPYFSKIFQVIKQLLLAIKAEAVANHAVARLRENKKVVMAFSSTNEAFLKYLIEDLDLSDGDIVDADFSLSLLRALENTLTYTVKAANGTVVKKKFDFDELIIGAEAEYYNLHRKIRNFSAGITISPIDVMKSIITEAGFSVAEITGRTNEIEFKGGNFRKGIYRKRKKENVKLAFDRFQNNEIDCLFINQSGSTGASAHAKPTKFVKPEEVKQRVMVIAEAELNINTEVQKRGRINRTGQLAHIPPIYDYVISAIPAEQRLMMMLQKKLKSLDANTTSNQKQSTSIIDTDDFINKYGDKIVAELLEEDRTLNMNLGDLVNEDTSSISELAHKATGRVAILPTEMQEAFYTTVLQRYKDYVELLQQKGEYDLELEAVDLKAELVEEEILIAGTKNTSVFSGNAYIGDYMCNVLKKPYTQSELEALITQKQDLLNGMPNIKEEICEFIENKAKDRIEILKEKLEFADEKEADKINDRIDKIRQTALKDRRNTEDLLTYFHLGRSVVMKDDSPAVCLGVKINKNLDKPFLPSNIKIEFAVANSTKYMALNFAKDQMDELFTIKGKYTYNDHLQTWTEQTKKYMASRIIRKIITGNILAAIHGYANHGKLISFTTIDGRNEKGILLNEKWVEDENKRKQYSNKIGVSEISLPIGICDNLIRNETLPRVFECTNGLKFGNRIDGAFLFETPAVTKENATEWQWVTKDKDGVLRKINGYGARKRYDGKWSFNAYNCLDIMLNLFKEKHFSVLVTKEEIEKYKLPIADDNIIKNRAWKKLKVDYSLIPQTANSNIDIELLELEAEALELELLLMHI